jgi:hypothetical protein
MFPLFFHAVATFGDHVRHFLTIAERISDLIWKIVIFLSKSWLSEFLFDVFFLAFAVAI